MVCPLRCRFGSHSVVLVVPTPERLAARSTSARKAWCAMLIATRRTPVVLATSIAALLAMAACSTNGGNGSGSAKKPTQPRGSITVRNSGGLTSSDPFQATGTSDMQMLRQVYEGLLSLDAKRRPIPMLAKSWKVSKDDLTYDLKLRQNVTFQDGRKMTAKDVVYSLEYDKKYGTNGQLDLGVMKSVDAVGKYEVRIQLERPYGPFLLTLAKARPIAIVPAHSADNHGLARKPIGTGPFMIKSFQNESKVVLKAYRQYKPIDIPTTPFGGKKVPLVDTITFLNVQDDETAVAGLTSRQYDIVDRIPPHELKRLKAQGSTVLQKSPGTQSQYLRINSARIKDKNLRAAILTAIDEQKVMDTTYAGIGTISSSYMPKQAAWYRPGPDQYWPWNGGVKEAKALLAKSSYHGQTITIINGGFAYMKKNALAVQQQLKAVGINTRVQPLDQTSFITRTHKGDFDLESAGGPESIPPAQFYAYYYCDHGEIKNRYGYCNDKFDTIFESATATQNADKRADQLGELERILKDDAALPRPLFLSDALVGVNKRVHGFQVNYPDWLNLWNVWVS